MTDPLHVVCFHANPMGWESRRRLYREFFDQINSYPLAKLHTIELAYGQSHFQTPMLSDILHLRANDLMWHKENALNVLIGQRLPSSWHYVAWIDADITFLNPNWVSEAIAQLKKTPVIQLFSQVAFLDADGQRANDTRPSLVAGTKYSRRHTASGWQETCSLAGHPGMAWAMTREAYEQLGGLGDWGITGSGDWHMACCLFQQMRRGRADMTPAVVAKWEEWQRRAKPLGPPGFIHGEIIHHWHGSRADRRYCGRHLILRNADPPYDPDLDIEPDPAIGLWRFTPRGERFREPLREYFESRREDGDGLESKK